MWPWWRLHLTLVGFWQAGDCIYRSWSLWIVILILADGDWLHVSNEAVCWEMFKTLSWLILHDKEFFQNIFHLNVPCAIFEHAATLTGLGPLNDRTRYTANTVEGESSSALKLIATLSTKNAGFLYVILKQQCTVKYSLPENEYMPEYFSTFPLALIKKCFTHNVTFKILAKMCVTHIKKNKPRLSKHNTNAKNATIMKQKRCRFLK